ncbi:MAG: ABC transporter permease [Acidimicrobiia bacterium]|nr:ABC transporter permease [Acidimicrobiia bacterium]
MWRATTRGLLARRLRLGLTALAVVLGVAFVSGTFVLTDTLRHAFDGLFAETVSDVDLVVWTRSPFEGAARQRERLPESLLDTIRAVPGVEAVEGVVQGDAQFVAPDGEAIQHGGAPTFGISWGDVSPLRIVDGRRPERDGEVAMDAGTAAGRGFAVGQRVRVLLQGPAEELTLVGTFSLGDRVDLGPVTFAAFDLETAQRVFAAEGVLDLVNVRAEPGADPVVLGDLVASALPGDYEVLPAREAADERARPVREGLAFLEGALLGFAGVGLFVGAFIIFNTFSILVSQRTRELGLLRALGASRPQVVGSVLAEAAALGAVASAVGLAAGIGLARLLLRLLDRLDFAVPGDLPSCSDEPWWPRSPSGSSSP